MKFAASLALSLIVVAASQEPKTPADASKLDADGPSGAPSISDDGDIVVFESSASNLVSDDTDGAWDVFAHSRKEHWTWRVSGNDAVPARSPSVSGDGNWIAYWQQIHPEGDESHFLWQVVLHEVSTGAWRRINTNTPPKYPYTLLPPRAPSMSRDGRWLVCEGSTSTNTSTMALLFDRSTGRTEIVSVSALGHPPARDVIEPSISTNGRFVVFCTDDGGFADAVASPTGFDIGIDHNHVFVRDRDSKTTRIASDIALREIGYVDFHDPLIMPDGRVVAYNQHDTRYGKSPEVGFVTNLKEQLPGRLLEVSGDRRFQGDACVTWMSADGRRVLVESAIEELAGLPKGQGRTQVYERDTEHNMWTLLSHSRAGAAGDGPSGGGVASSDLGVIAFWSCASNVVADDFNGWSDVFVLDKSTGNLERISVAASK